MAKLGMMRPVAAAMVLAAVVALTSGCGWGRTVADRKAMESDGSGTPAQSCVDTSAKSIAIGFVNSLSGTMALSEKTVSDSLHMAVDEINAKGGVLGKKLEVVQQDGKSEPAVFAEKAKTLIEKNCVAAVFGGWTSASRKAMKPVFEADDALLFYPLQYEGMEASPNIFYTGAAPNQQIVPALDYLKEQGRRRLFLVGSDYVFPQTANRIVRAYAKHNGMQIVGEEYTPMGATDFSTIVNKLKASGADAVVNTLNGDSNVAFFKEYKASGLQADSLPVISMSIAYTSVYLWKEMVEKAKSFAVDDVKRAADGVTFDAPEGKVTVDGENHHNYKTSYIGRIGDDRLIHTVWKSDGPIKPDPYLKAYAWAGSLQSPGSDSSK